MTDGEHYQEIAEDLQNLLNLGINIKSITSDGDKSLIKAIKKAFTGLANFTRRLI